MRCFNFLLASTVAVFLFANPSHAHYIQIPCFGPCASVEICSPDFDEILQLKRNTLVHDFLKITSSWPSDDGFWCVSVEALSARSNQDLQDQQLENLVKEVLKKLIVK